ncbi:hypothetical protein OD760_29975 [Pseudomonas aeruginosa]|nr:hypothetical protein [Pseudomonas aeruginosa]
MLGLDPLLGIMAGAVSLEGGFGAAAGGGGRGGGGGAPPPPPPPFCL